MGNIIGQQIGRFVVNQEGWGWVILFHNNYKSNIIAICHIHYSVNSHVRSIKFGHFCESSPKEN